MSIKSEILALMFGALLILVTFGDDHLGGTIGNLDSIFGLRIWPFIDLGYPLAAVVIFLLYGITHSKSVRIVKRRIVLAVFLSYILILALVSLDDIIILLNNVGLQLPISLPKIYWIALSWIYPVYGALSFFLFGKLQRTDA